MPLCARFAVTVIPLRLPVKSPVLDLLLINVRLAKTIRANWLTAQSALNLAHLVTALQAAATMSRRAYQRTLPRCSITQTRYQAFARASSASRTSILRKPPGEVTRCGKSSRKVLPSAIMSSPSGSQPVQRQSAASAPSSVVA
jgi:hypothetical protein